MGLGSGPSDGPILLALANQHFSKLFRFQDLLDSTARALWVVSHLLTDTFSLPTPTKGPTSVEVLRIMSSPEAPEVREVRTQNILLVLFLTSAVGGIGRAAIGGAAIGG